MSSVKGVNRTLMDTPTPGNRLDPGLFDGRVKVSPDTYEASILATGSDIKMGGTLLKGTRILAIHLAWDALGGDATLSVGDAEEAARYISAVSAIATGEKWGDVVDGINYEVDETDSDNLDNQIVITVGGSSAVTGTIKITIFYTRD